MDKTFMKEGKSAEEVEEVLNYVIKEDLNPSEMKGLYDNWAKQYDEVNSLVYLQKDFIIIHQELVKISRGIQTGIYFLFEAAPLIKATVPCSFNLNNLYLNFGS